MSTRDYIEKDYYATLGVPKDADKATIRKAYRKLAREFHPDAKPGDQAAEEKFKEISEAYDVLADDERRREYDEARTLFGSGAFGGGFRGAPGGGMPFDLGDLLGGGLEAAARCAYRRPSFSRYVAGKRQRWPQVSSFCR